MKGSVATGRQGAELLRDREVIGRRHGPNLDLPSERLDADPHRRGHLCHERRRRVPRDVDRRAVHRPGRIDDEHDLEVGRSSERRISGGHG
jgi:hypothetical protein